MQIGSVDEEKPFLHHLDELRTMLIRMVITLLVSTVLCFVFAPELMDIIRKPVDAVWMTHEQNHLSEGVDAAEWGDAKALANALAGLSGDARQVALGFVPERKRQLAECAILIKAARQLDVSDQATFIRSTASGEEVAALAEGLNASGAVLAESDGKGSLKMMEAFQPSEGFMLSMKLAFYAGIIVSSPLLIFFLLQFIVPGLLQNERRILYRSMFYGFGLFLTGVLFAYFVVLPRVLSFFYTYSLEFGIANDWRIGYYVSFATRLVTMFGLAFELPIVVFPFIKLGILSYELMSSTRRYAIVGICVLAAVITPTPDAFTMMLMAVPMYALYELCIMLAWREDKRRRQRELEEREQADRAYGLDGDDSAAA